MSGTEQLSLFDGDAPRPLTKGGTPRSQPVRAGALPPPILLATAPPEPAPEEDALLDLPVPPELPATLLVARIQGEAVTLTLGEEGQAPTVWQQGTRDELGRLVAQVLRAYFYSDEAGDAPLLETEAQEVPDDEPTN